MNLVGTDIYNTYYFHPNMPPLPTYLDFLCVSGKNFHFSKYLQFFLLIYSEKSYIWKYLQ